MSFFDQPHILTISDIHACGHLSVNIPTQTKHTHEILYT